MPADTLAISMGDPAGIGPEIVVKTWRERKAGDPAFFAIGDPNVYARAFERLGARGAVTPIESASQAARIFPDNLPVLPVSVAIEEIPGSPNSANAAAIVGSIERGVALCLAGECAGLVTCPISKVVLYDAGFHHPGHTEFVAELTASASYEGPRGPVMMLAGPSLRVALASVHLPLQQAVATLSADKIIRVAEVVAAALRNDFGIASPRIALAGLNPHAGEGGALGREELEIINPAAAKLRARGLNVTDAKPADALFHEAARRGYDAVIAMYHDQGLIPLKTLHFWDGVNVTLGLPIVRTSPDHGVAFDIAGKGAARPESLIAALAMARDIAQRRTLGRTLVTA
ncbi:MAG: 4-hydroxythreonine-4-phosphate dehydrogenase PdxA [Alphaproteobacteria bacterium]